MGDSVRLWRWYRTIPILAMALAAALSLGLISMPGSLIRRYMFPVHYESLILESSSRHGASPADTDKLGWNAIMQAALGNPHPGVATLLAKAGVNVNSKDASGKTALMLAAGAQDARMIRELLALGADRTLRDGKGRTALDYANKRRPHGEAARLLDAR